MSADKVILDRAVRDLDESPAYDPISCVRLITGTDQEGNQIVYVAGDPKSGRTIDVENRLIRDSTQGQQVANNILQAIQGYAYKPYSASGAILDPAAEIGDGVSVDEVYSVLADIETTFSPLMTANIGAPEDGAIDHEYPYESSQDRTLIQELAQMKTSFIVEQGRIAAEISEVKTTADGTSRKVTTLEQTVNGIHAYTDLEIKTLAGGVVEDWADINFTPDGIASKVSSKFDAKGAASTALTDSKAYTDGEIELIAGEYTSAIEQTAKQIKSTVAAQESKWDLSGLPSGVTISAYGYGTPKNNKLPAGYDPGTKVDYTGKYYLDQTAGRWYYSDGTTWTRQSGSLKLITTNLSTRISQTASGLESVVEDISDLGTRMTAIEQTSTDITLSVYGDAYGKTYFKLSDGTTTLSSQELYLNVDSAHIVGELTAQKIVAGASIYSPMISGATISGSSIVGGRFQDATGYAALQLWSYSGDPGAGVLYYGPYNSSNTWNAYFEVSGQGRGTYPYTAVYIGGAFAFLADDGKIYPRGVWDFSNCTVRGLP